MSAMNEAQRPAGAAAGFFVDLSFEAVQHRGAL
jgi:hypothetical protein